MSLTQSMALRVLLADESPTIKKVFQLALQDYAVDVTSVGVGIDVVPVARQFKPDIIFCDILLQKRNGYDVCAEIKNDQQLRSLPVILMWSSFMELDQDKTQAARADGDLQKPFEVQDLRQIVNQFVAKTRQQRLGGFLNFPKMPEMVDTPPAVGATQINSDGSAEPSVNQDWNMDNFDPIPAADTLNDGAEDFQELPLPPSPKMDDLDDLESETEQEWSTKSLGRFQVEPDNLSHDMAVSVPDDDGDLVLDLENDDDVQAVQPPTPQPFSQHQSQHRKTPASTLASPVPTAEPSAPVRPMSEAQIEKIVREQARALIESVVWKVVPDLATQIIEREIQRLLAEKNP